MAPSILRTLVVSTLLVTVSDGRLRSQADTRLLHALKERVDYATLDQQAVETIARLARSRWPRELSGFDYLRVEHFSAGGASHWMSTWLHRETGLEFVLLPGGRFQMGSPPSEADRRDDELQHWVTLDPFLVARTECTWGAWNEVGGAAGTSRRGQAESDRHPVSGIGPADVEVWCRAARLTFPTEAQWEYLCRGGTTTAWAMGSNKADLARFANLGSAECPESWKAVPGITEDWHDGHGDGTAPVGSFGHNAFGLFDVHGNLSEWCRDQYFSYEVKPEKGTGLRAGVSGEQQARGGNFGGGAAAARSAKRLTCGDGRSPGGNHGFGFRPSLDLPW
ncbi:MAG: formylglycine-generating enzyme family protein [Acidobacteriota bacterium]